MAISRLPKWLLVMAIMITQRERESVCVCVCVLVCVWVCVCVCVWFTRRRPASVRCAQNFSKVRKLSDLLYKWAVELTFEEFIRIVSRIDGPWLTKFSKIRKLLDLLYKWAIELTFEEFFFPIRILSRIDGPWRTPLMALLLRTPRSYRSVCDMTHSHVSNDSFIRVVYARVHVIYGDLCFAWVQMESYMYSCMRVWVYTYSCDVFSHSYMRVYAHTYRTWPCRTQNHGSQNPRCVAVFRRVPCSVLQGCKIAGNVEYWVTCTCVYAQN